MDGQVKVSNRLLALLPSAELALLAPHLQTVTLQQDAVLTRSDDRIEQIYFPHSGTISIMVDMPNGQTVACAIIGREGALGALSVLGPSRSITTAIVRSPGVASRMSAARFHVAVSQSRAVRQIVEIHARTILAQITHVAACNALHPAEKRIARWLLHIHDRMEHNVLPLTQEVIAELLGVRRTTVTETVQKLRASGAISYDRRGMLEIVNRKQLERTSCDCYEIMHRQMETIFAQQAIKQPVEITNADMAK